MGIVTKIYATGYNANNINEAFVSYKNTSTNIEYIQTLQAHIGIGLKGAKYTWDDDVTGTGKPLNVTMYNINNTSQSATVQVTNPIGSQSGSNTTDTYPIYTNCQWISFNFNPAIPINPSQTITFYVKADAASENSVLIFDNRKPETATVPESEYKTRIIVSTNQQCVISFDVGNKNVNTPSSIVANIGDTIALPLLGHVNEEEDLILLDPKGGYCEQRTCYTYTKYTHTDWYDGNKSYLADGSTATYPVSGNITLTAVYSFEDTVPAVLPIAEKEGYTFLGWSLSEDALQVDVRAGRNYYPDEDDYAEENLVILYAVYGLNESYFLTIDPNGGIIYPGGPEYKNDISTTNMTPCSQPVTKQFIYGARRHLADLYYNSNGEYVWHYSFSSKPWIGSAFKYGYTNSTWAVTEGGGDVEECVAEYGLAHVLAPDASHATDFMLYQPNENNVWIFDGQYEGDVTIVAQWTPNKYHFTFNINAPLEDCTAEEIANINTPSQITNQAYDTIVDLPTLPDLQNWKFIGWNLKSTNTTALNTDSVSDFVIMGDIDRSGADKYGCRSDVTIPLYAIWKRKGGSISIYVDNEWKTAIPHVYRTNPDTEEKEWKPVSPYIYTKDNNTDQYIWKPTL